MCSDVANMSEQEQETVTLSELTAKIYFAEAFFAIPNRNLDKR